MKLPSEISLLRPTTMNEAVLKTDTAMECAMSIQRSLQIIRRAQQYESYKPHGEETIGAAFEQIATMVEVLAGSINALLRRHRTDLIAIQIDVTRESDIMVHPDREFELPY